MPDCELCGRPGARYKVLVEGAILNVCAKCAKYGKKLGRNWQNVQQSDTDKPKPKAYVPREFREEYELIENYGHKIREIREKSNLTLEEFAKQLKERASYIDKIENHKAKPDKKLADKIYKQFKLKLYVPASESEGVSTSKKSQGMSLFDIYLMEKNNKK